MTMTAEKQDWRTRGACRSQDPEIYWPNGDPRRPPAEIRCWICPVAKECLEYALRNEPEGIWGGMTAAQRRSLNRPRQKITCVSCGGVDILDQTRTELCLTCGLSWVV